MNDSFIDGSLLNPSAAFGRFEPVAGSALPAPVDADDEADDWAGPWG